MSEGRSGGRRFNSATDAEILKADVADSYFHRTMQILRARGLEDTPVHAELAYKTSNPDAWFVVAGLPPQMGRAFRLHKLEGLSQAQTAQAARSLGRGSKSARLARDCR